MKSKRMWVISEFYYPIVTSTGYYMTEIAEFLASKGIDVNVISTSSKYNEIENYKFLPFETHSNVKIKRILSREIDKNNFLKRIWRLLKLSILISFKILSNIKKDEDVLLVTNPAFLILFMPFLSKIKRFKYTLLVHDIFPENLVAIGKISKDSFINKILTRLYNWAYSKSESCIAIGRDMSRVIESKTGMHSIELIPNWADVNDVYPIPKDQTDFYINNDLSGFVFMFAGNLGQAQGLDNLLEAVNRIEISDIKFLFVGGGAKADDIKKQSLLHTNIIYKGFQDRSKQNDFLNACDIGIVTLSDGMYGLGVPSKSYNIMAAGKPILYVGEEDSEIALCIRENKIGWVVEPNNPQALCDMIISIYEQRDELEQMGRNARLVAEKVYAKDIVLEKYYSYFTRKKID